MATDLVAHYPRPTSGLPRTICRRCTPGGRCRYLGPGAGVIQTVSVLAPWCIPLRLRGLLHSRVSNVHLVATVMEIGNFCSDAPGENPLCENEERAHMALWCIVRLIARTYSLSHRRARYLRLPRLWQVSSPLVLGFNMSNSVDMDRVWPTITNSEAIAVDHAWAGSPGMLFKTLLVQNNSIEVLRPLAPMHPRLHLPTLGCSARARDRERER